jgi:hypothetical protein
MKNANLLQGSDRLAEISYTLFIGNRYNISFIIKNLIWLLNRFTARLSASLQQYYPLSRLTESITGFSLALSNPNITITTSSLLVW